jgi:hypothetical protein
MIYGGQSFRAVLRDLGLTSNQVWGLTKTDEKWSQQLESALTAVEATSSMEPMPHMCVAVSAASAGSTSASGWRGVVLRSPTLTRAATRLVKKDDHLTCRESTSRPGRLRGRSCSAGNR